MRLEDVDRKKIKLVCLDSDGVTVRKGTDFLADGRMETFGLRRRVYQWLEQLKSPYWVNITSGRCMDFLKVRYGGLWGDKFSLQSEIGNFTWIDGKVWEEEWSGDEWRLREEMEKRLRFKLEGKLGVKGLEPKERIITIHCRERMKIIESVVSEVDKDGWFYCWWNGEAFDIGLRRINKKTALLRLIEHLGIEMSEVMTVGNGVNDAQMEDKAGVSVSTNGQDLGADVVLEGEERGGERVMEWLIGEK